MNRNPNGKFVGQEDMLGAWLPVFLSWVFRDSLRAMLVAAMRWCDAQAAHEYEMAAHALIHPESWADPEHLAHQCVSDADRWFRRKAILSDAAARLKELS